MIGSARACWLLPLALAGCSPPQPAPSGEDAEPVTETTRLPPPETEMPGKPLGGLRELAGEWRLAGVDGQDLNQPEGIAVSIEGATMQATAGCVRWQWAITLDQGAFSARPVPLAEPSCARGLTASERTMADAITGASEARRLPSMGVELSGGGRSVVLFSQ